MIGHRAGFMQKSSVQKDGPRRMLANYWVPFRGPLFHRDKTGTGWMDAGPRFGVFRSGSRQPMLLRTSNPVDHDGQNRIAESKDNL